MAAPPMAVTTSRLEPRMAPTKPAAARKTTVKKATTKKPIAKKPIAKKPTTKKAMGKKAPTKKAPTKKTPAKKTPAKKYELKTKPTQISPSDYIAALPDPQRQQDCRALVKLMTAITGQKPVMWGPSIVGFDTYHYRYDSGHEGDMCVLGFASRGAELVVYLLPGLEGSAPLLAKLGRHRASKACVYFRRLADIDLGVLEELLRQSAADTRRRYP